MGFHSKNIAEAHVFVHASSGTARCGKSQLPFRANGSIIIHIIFTSRRLYLCPQILHG
jgi:hypothetical protein